MKIDTVYFQIVTFGVMIYFPFFSLLASNNYWTQFYSLQFTTYASCTYNVLESLGSIVSVPLMKKVSIHSIVNITLIFNLLSLILIPVLVFISNKLTRSILTLIPIALMGICGGTCLLHWLPLPLKLSNNTLRRCNQVLKILFFYTGTLFGGSDENQVFLENLCYFLTAFLYIVLVTFLWQQMTKQHQFARQVIANYDEAEGLLHGSDNDSLQPIKVKLSKKSINIGIAMFFTQFITYLTFPALTTSIPFIQNINSGLQFLDPQFSLWIMSSYLFSDFFGRMIIKSRFIQRFYSYQLAVTVAYFRICLVPLFFIVNLPRPKEQVLPLIHNDIFSFILVAIFSLTGGMNLTVIFVRAQDNILSVQEIHKISNFISIMCTVGCTVSSFVAIPISLIVKDE